MQTSLSVALNLFYEKECHLVAYMLRPCVPCSRCTQNFSRGQWVSVDPEAVYTLCENTCLIRKLL
jgi:hypothetical protein